MVPSSTSRFLQLSIKSKQNRLLLKNKRRLQSKRRLESKRNVWTFGILYMRSMYQVAC